MSKIILAAAAALTLGFAGQALAADAGNTQSVPVAGVNFADRTAVNDFYAKLTRAAAEACDSYSANSRVTAQDRLCTNRAVASAVQQLNRPVLTAMYQERTVGQPARQLASR
jgi:UrcA family protein